MLTWIVIGTAVVAVVVLGRNLNKRFASDRIEKLVEGRRAASRLVSRGELIDGTRHLAVSLALSESALYYESSDMQGSLDLEWIGEVEYDDDVVTGQYIGDGKILTIRCYSQAFRFLIPIDALLQWQAVLPAHRKAALARTAGDDAHLVWNRELSRAEDEGWPTLGAAPALSPAAKSR